MYVHSCVCLVKYLSLSVLHKVERGTLFLFPSIIITVAAAAAATALAISFSLQPLSYIFRLRIYTPRLKILDGQHFPTSLDALQQLTWLKNRCSVNHRFFSKKRIRISLSNSPKNKKQNFLLSSRFSNFLQAPYTGLAS